MSDAQPSPVVKGQLYTVSAPSGAGKTSLVGQLVRDLPGVEVSVSHTTRARREGEVDGLNYHFVDQARFEAMLAADDFLEHACVFNNFYGTAGSAVKARLESGIDVILEIDWQGAAQIKTLLPDTLSIFILPPSVGALRARLTGRGQDDADTIDRRMQAAVNEISHYRDADYLIINDDFQTALTEMTELIHAQRLRLHRQAQRHSGLLEELLA